MTAQENISAEMIEDNKLNEHKCQVQTADHILSRGAKLGLELKSGNEPGYSI